MAKKKSWVRNRKGKATHIRETSEDGKKSYLYKVKGGLSGLITGPKGSCVEIAEHRDDGSTDAYEADTSLIGMLFHGGKGSKKNK